MFFITKKELINLPTNILFYTESEPGVLKYKTFRNGKVSKYIKLHSEELNRLLFNSHIMSQEELVAKYSEILGTSYTIIDDDERVILLEEVELKKMCDLYALCLQNILNMKTQAFMDAKEEEKQKYNVKTVEPKYDNSLTDYKTKEENDTSEDDYNYDNYKNS